MGLGYRAVGWNRQKRVYDATLLAGVGLYLAVFVGVGVATDPTRTAESHLIRGLGTAAYLLLHVILCIGPLCRLDPRFLPLLYNRRHAGVTMFLLALGHGTLAFVLYHTLGDVNPFVSVLASDGAALGSVSRFPFQVLGVGALAILFLMAATSHDFWLANLTAPVWKALHMLVYVAWALAVGHVTLGALQSERSPILAGLVVAGAAAVVALHLAAGLRERAGDVELASGDGDASWLDVCAVEEIPEARARVVCAGGERVAVFRWDGRVAAVSSVCQHQNGPLGEGKVVDGCITCPWHGYQYRPESGRSPEPFHERVPTFRTRVVAGRVQLDPRPRPAGTPVEPARVSEGGGAG